ncbi:MAG: hypothetical protein IJM59_00115 [Proteobacteria bacterium]|nr:hypothetical protein [Pseudomonadota bacterium]
MRNPLCSRCPLNSHIPRDLLPCDS